MLGLLGALMMQAVSGDSPVTAPPGAIVAPDWERKATGDDVARLYPRAALAAHVEGRAAIHCVVAATGDLIDCSVIGEDPPGQGFGEAALAMSKRFKMRPLTRDGRPVAGGQVNLPIRFSLPR